MFSLFNEGLELSNHPGDLLFRLVLVIFGVFALMISYIFLPFVLHHYKSRREERRNAMESESRELGLAFDEREDYNLVRNLKFLAHLDEGKECFALHAMRGDYNGHDIQAFDYHYKMPGVWWWSPSWYAHGYFSFITLELENEFPELLLRPEKGGAFKRVADMFGKRDIDFESREFSEKFDVRCKDKKFAYDFCNARMIEYLMSKPIVPIEVEKNVMTVAFGTPVPTAKIAEHLEHLIDVRRHMPAYLFDT